MVTLYDTMLKIDKDKLDIPLNWYYYGGPIPKRMDKFDFFYNPNGPVKRLMGEVWFDVLHMYRHCYFDNNAQTMINVINVFAKEFEKEKYDDDNKGHGALLLIAMLTMVCNKDIAEQIEDYKVRVKMHRENTGVDDDGAWLDKRNEFEIKHDAYITARSSLRNS